MNERDKLKIINCPKYNLHLHIEGTLTKELTIKFNQRNNLNVKFTDEDFSTHFESLSSFLSRYYKRCTVLKTYHDFFDLAYAYGKKAKEQNIVYYNVSFDPSTHLQRGLDFNDVLNGIYDGLNKIKKEHNIGFRINACILRDHPHAEAKIVVNNALKNKNKISIIGLDSNEICNKATKFKDLFEKAHENNFLIDIHAGEGTPPTYI